jgi:hypothetical protein
LGYFPPATQYWAATLVRHRHLRPPARRHNRAAYARRAINSILTARADAELADFQLPDAYGIDDRSFQESFGAQMLYPFVC